MDCAATGCNLPARSKGLCLKHYSRCWNMSIAPEDVDLLADGECQICHKYGRIVVDHDHSCCPEAGMSCGDCIRGLLCYECNMGAGWMEKYRDQMNALLAYVDSPPGVEGRATYVSGKRDNHPGRKRKNLGSS